TLTDSGPGATLTPGSGSTSFTLAESGSSRGGSLSQTETGSDRYSLLQSFDNVANTAGAGTPGHLDFSPAGLPFTDPPPAAPPIRPAQGVRPAQGIRPGVRGSVIPEDRVSEPDLSRLGGDPLLVAAEQQRMEEAVLSHARRAYEDGVPLEKIQSILNSPQ